VRSLRLAVLPDAELPEEHGARVGDLDGQGAGGQHRGGEDEADSGQDQVEGPLGDHLPPGEGDGLQVEEGLVGHRLGPHAADVDAPDAAGEVDVDAGHEQVAHDPVELGGRQGAGGHQHAVGPGDPHGLDDVVDVAQPGDVVAPVGDLGGTADDAADPEAQLGVVADEVVEVEALLVGAHDDDRAAVPTGPAVGLEPGPVPVTGGGEEGEAHRGAADDIVEGEVDPEAPLAGLEEEGGEDGGAAEPDRLHRPDGAHPGQVETLGGDHGQRGGGGEGDGHQDVRERGHPGAVEPVGHQQSDRPGGGDRRGVEQDQDASQRL
jgi:hypothetical protein